MTIDNKDTDRATTQTKMQQLRRDSATHEVIPGQGMSSYEKGIAYNKLKERYEEQNKNNPSGGFKPLFRKKSKSKRKSRSKKSKSKKSRRKIRTKTQKKRY